MKPDCLSTLSSLVYQNENVRLLVYAHPHDHLPVKDLVTSLNVIGQNNVLLDLPQIITKKIQSLSGYTALEESSGDFDESRASNIVLQNYFVSLALIYFLVM